jgi:hypothetical protein
MFLFLLGMLLAVLFTRKDDTLLLPQEQEGQELLTYFHVVSTVCDIFEQSRLHIDGGYGWERWSPLQVCAHVNPI